MTWGMETPGSFGAYFPDGEYVGWEETLKQYFVEEMNDEEKLRYHGRYASYARQVAQKFRLEIGVPRKHDPALTPLQPHEIPTEFKVLVNKGKPFGSLMMLTSGLLAVDEELKAIIEELEPGVHAFWPIKITMPKGDPYPKQYHVMQIATFLDSFRPEESDEGSWRFSGFRYYVKLPNKQCYSGLAMSTAVIGSHHLWWERRLGRPETCISDTLQAAIKKAGLKVPKLSKLKDV